MTEKKKTQNHKKENSSNLEDKHIPKEENKENFDLSYLDWIFSKGWLRVKKTDF